LHETTCLKVKTHFYVSKVICFGLSRGRDHGKQSRSTSLCGQARSEAIATDDCLRHWPPWSWQKWLARHISSGFASLDESVACWTEWLKTMISPTYTAMHSTGSQVHRRACVAPTPSVLPLFYVTHGKKRKMASVLNIAIW